LSLSERKNRIAQKKESWKKKLEAGEVDAWRLFEVWDMMKYRN
jgi:hypothetical protein